MDFESFTFCYVIKKFEIQTDAYRITIPVICAIKMDSVIKIMTIER